MRATDIELLHARYLFVGPFGCGKTYLLGMFHNALKAAGTKGLYLFDFDKGVGTLKSAGFDVEFDSYFDRNPLRPNAWEDFQKRFTKFEQDNEGYGGFAVDSLTGLHTALMNFVLSINKIKGRRHVLPGMNSPGLTVENDYGVLVNLMTQLFPQLFYINEHSDFFMTAHTREIYKKVPQTIGENEIMMIDSLEKFAPAIAGKRLPSKIGGYFTEVWRIFSEGRGDGTVRKAQTASGNMFDCKTQIAKMPYQLPVEEAMKRALEMYGWNKKLQLAEVKK